MTIIQRSTSVQILSLANYPSGSQGPFGPVEIADDVTRVLFKIARCTSSTPTIWPNASTILTVTPELSLDGGVTWSECGKSVSPGGIAIVRGVELAFSLSGGSLLPAVNGVTRQYRVSTDIVGGPLRSSASAEVG